MAKAMEAKGRNSVCVCVPAYNAEKKIEPVLKSLIELKKAGLIKAILVVNDGSRDNTVKVVEKYAKDVELIGFPENKGKAAAVGEGMRWAKRKKAEIFGMFDADLKEITAEQFGLMRRELGKEKVKMAVGNSLLDFRGTPWNATVNSGQRLIRMDALKPFFIGNNRWTRLVSGEFKERKKRQIEHRWERAGYGLELALNHLFEGATSHVETNFKSAPASIAGDGSFIALRGRELDRVSKLTSERREKFRQAREKRKRRLDARQKRNKRRPGK